jgi:hypothetical protein
MIRCSPLIALFGLSVFVCMPGALCNAQGTPDAACTESWNTYEDHCQYKSCEDTVYYTLPAYDGDDYTVSCTYVLCCGNRVTTCGPEDSCVDLKVRSREVAGK